MSLYLVYDTWRGATHALEHDTGCAVVYCITKYKLFVVRTSLHFIIIANNVLKTAVTFSLPFLVSYSGITDNFQYTEF